MFNILQEALFYVKVYTLKSAQAFPNGCSSPTQFSDGDMVVGPKEG